MRSYLPLTYNTLLILPLQNRQLRFNSCLVQILIPFAIFLADLPRRIPHPTARLQRQRAPHYLQSWHRLLPSLQICQVGNLVNSAPTMPARSPLHTIPTLSATFLADLLRRKLCQQRAYKASALPILYPLKSAGALRQLWTLNNGTVLLYTVDKLIVSLCLLSIN